MRIVTRRPTVPLAQLTDDFVRGLASRGGRVNNLYRAIGGHPELLESWTEFVWSVRERCATPIALRELVILRVTQLMRDEYTRRHHVERAVRLGMPEEKIAALETWRTSSAFNADERAALAFTDLAMAGDGVEAGVKEFEAHFDPAERVELVLTMALYEMVCRVVIALGVPND